AGGGGAPGPALERGQAGLQGGPGGVLGAGVLVARVLTGGALGEGRGQVHGRHHRPGGFVGVLAGVDGPRLEPGRGVAQRGAAFGGRPAERGGAVPIGSLASSSLTMAGGGPGSRAGRGGGGRPRGGPRPWPPRRGPAPGGPR